MLTLPGTPIIRYGDEIGMGDDLRLPERNCARTPMQWSDEPQGGFSVNETPVLPPTSQGPWGFQHVNVAAQRRDPNSLLNWTERLLRMRKEVPEIGWGEFTLLRTGTQAVLAMRYDWRNNAALFVHNLSAQPREVRIAPGAKGSHDGVLINLLTEDHSEPDLNGIHHIVLAPYGYCWFRVGGLDYLLRRPAAAPPQS
jgi:maltose alpha-D-glucosyltransferase/alpha-amylase